MLARFPETLSLATEVGLDSRMASYHKGKAFLYLAVAGWTWPG